MIRYSEFCEICKELNLEVHRDYIFTNEKYTHDIIIDGVLANTDIECVCRLFSEKYRYKHQNITPEPNKRIYEFEYLVEFIPDKDYPRPDLVHPKMKKVKLFFDKEYVKKCLKQSLKAIKDLETHKKKIYGKTKTRRNTRRLQMNFREYIRQTIDDDKLALNLNEAISLLNQKGYTLGKGDDEGDPLDSIPFYENERFEAWARKQGIDVYLSDESLCEKKYEEYKRLVRAKRDFE